jgi:hypothetical protein
MKSKPMNFLLCVSVVAIALITGCGQSNPELCIVEGKVTHNGRPVPKLYLVFRPANLMKAAESCALTDENGRFEMMIGSTPGVFRGPNTVTADDPHAADGRTVSDDPEYLEVITKYSPEKSTYKVDVRKNMYSLEIKFD